MSGSRPLVSIVCPAYEEEEVLPLFHGHLSAVLDSLADGYSFEIIYVDDGSRDGTLASLQSLANLDARVSYLSLSRNFGHQAALTAGLEHARGDVVISMDADLQHPPHMLAELLHQWRQGFDVVITIREDDTRLSLFKRYSSRAFYWLMQRFSDTEIRIAASDFRLLSRKAVQALLRMREPHRFVRGMVQWLGFRVKECRFQPDERKAGVSKYTIRRMLTLAGDGLFSFSRTPLRVPIWLGVVFLSLGLVHAVSAAANLLQGGDGAAWNYLLMSVHFGVGSLLGSMGILGEYLGRVHEQGKERPIYLLKETCMKPESAMELSRREAA